MNENTKKTYTAEEFKAICKDVLPSLEALVEAIKKNKIDDYVRVYVRSDGYISMEGTGLSGWELYNYGDGFIARHTYTEKIVEERV